MAVAADRESLSGTSATTPLPDDNYHTAGSTTDEEKATIDNVSAVDGDGEYPSGMALLFIVLALGMSMFLVALDMVSLSFSRHQLQRSFRLVVHSIVS